jgi:hypothetical protein
MSFEDAVLIAAPALEGVSLSCGIDVKTKTIPPD